MPEPAATPAGAAAAWPTLVSRDKLTDDVGRATRLAELHGRHDTVLLLDDAAAGARPVAAGLGLDHVGAPTLPAFHAALRSPHIVFRWRLPIKRHCAFEGPPPLLSLECVRARVCVMYSCCVSPASCRELVYPCMGDVGEFGLLRYSVTRLS